MILNILLWHWFIKITDFRPDGWIEEFIKRKWGSGLFWTVGAAEKKKLPAAISMQLYGVVSSTFSEQKIEIYIFKIF